jgi:hypothetical protein
MVYMVPEGFKENDTRSEQLVNSIEEGQGILGFVPDIAVNTPDGYSLDSVAVVADERIMKLNYSKGIDSKVIVLQRKSDKDLKPAPSAIQGKINGNIAEIQDPLIDNPGILGGGIYAGVTDLSSIRWIEGDFEYAVIGNTSLEELGDFVSIISNASLEIPAQETNKPGVEVIVDIEVEKNDQQSVDTGSSPWKLDPSYVAQVFVSLEMSPGGITGDYPVKYEELKVIQNNGIEAVIEVLNEESPIKRVYLKKLVRQDTTGIWTVVGYDLN